MNSAELTTALRYCAEHEACDNDAAAKCPYEHHWTDGEDCQSLLLVDAAIALEAAGRQIARLEEDLKTREAEREVLQDTIKICEEAADRYRAQLQAAHYYNKLVKRLRDLAYHMPDFPEPIKPKTVTWSGVDLEDLKKTCEKVSTVSVKNDANGEWIDMPVDEFFRMLGNKRMMEGEKDGQSISH